MIDPTTKKIPGEIVCMREEPTLLTKNIHSKQVDMNKMRATLDVPYLHQSMKELHS